MLIVLSCLAFISLGLPDGLLGVAWPSIRSSFGRDLDALGVLLAAATGGYVASSFASGRLLRRLNLAAVLALSCLVTAAALSAYAVAAHWATMIVFAVVLGFGGGAIDSALNTYVAVNYGPRMLNWLHACYGIGAAGGPMIMTAVLTRGLPWQRGYALVAGAQAVLAAAFVATHRSWPHTGHDRAATDERLHATIAETLRLPAAQLGVAAFVAYAGVEASFGAWTFTLLTAGRGMPTLEAGALVSLFWGGLTTGRLLAAFVGVLLPVGRLLGGAVWSVALGAVLVWATDSALLTLAGVLIAGLACGPIFPTLVALTPGRVGPEHSANAVGFQIAAASLGLSLVPGAVGVLAERTGVETIATLFVVLSVVLVLVYRVLERVAPSRVDDPVTREPAG